MLRKSNKSTEIHSMPETEVTANEATAAELVDHLCRNSRLTAQEAQHLVAEVLAYFSQTPEEFLRARHQELQSQGFGNAAIFSTLQLELNSRRFAARPLSTRQIRRAIYG